MSATLITEEYKYFDFIHSDTAECPVDAEYYLPDYCPDIQKILKCVALPQVESVSLSSDKLNVMGNLSLTVLYLDENGKSIRSCELNKEFTSVIKITGSTENASAYVRSSTGHIICRAVSARKLDIHVPIILETTVCDLKSDALVSSTENMEKKTINKNASEAVKMAEHEFAINEEFELTGSAPPIESVLRKSVSFSSVSAKVYDDSVHLEGNADICLSYRGFSDDSVLEKMQYSVPFSEDIGCDGVDPECFCSAVLTTGEISVQAKEDSMGEYTKLSVFIKIFSNISVYRNVSLELVSDGYTVQCGSRESYCKKTIQSYDNQQKLSFSLEKSISLDSSERILDIWTSEATAASFSETGKIVYRGRFLLSVLYLNSDKRICFTEKTIDFNYPVEYNDSVNRKSYVVPNIVIEEFRLISENEMNINFLISLNGMIMSRDTVNVLNSIETFEDRDADSKGKVILCYKNFTGNDELWSVGKKYRIPVDELKRINGISDDSQISYPLVIYR